MLDWLRESFNQKRTRVGVDVKIMVVNWSILPRSWKQQAKEFFNKSTLHGVRYIAETERPIYERLIWLWLTGTGGVITILIIVSLWSKFQTNATITGLDTDFHNWDAPFPAVTICPHHPLNDTLIDNYIHRKFPTPIDEEKLLYYKRFVIQMATLSYANMENISEFSGDKSLPQENLRDILPEVLMPCDSIIFNCQWKDNPYECCEGFLPIRTEHGFCYSFNCMKVDTELFTDREKEVPQSTQYIYETDTKWSLVFNLDRPEKEAVRVYLHSTDDFPSFDLEPQLVWQGQIAKLFFSSKDTYTTDNARQLSIAQRKCIFEEERPLLTASKYSYVACMLQCRMQKTLQLCHCVPHFYTQIDGFPFCNLTGLLCLAQNMNEISRSLACPCELGCSNTVYEVEKLIDAVGREETLEVGFVSWPMVRYKREVLFGWVDLLVSFGGIAGLFLGFSLVSGIEIFYYFTIRAACMVTDDDVATPTSPPAAVLEKDKDRDSIFWLNDQLMLMKQQMAQTPMNKTKNKSLKMKRNSNSLYSIPYLN